MVYCVRGGKVDDGEKNAVLSLSNFPSQDKPRARIHYVYFISWAESRLKLESYGPVFTLSFHFFGHLPAKR